MSTYPTGLLSEVIEGFDAGTSVNAEDRPAGLGEKGVLKVSAVGPGHFRARENKAVLARELGRIGPEIARGDILISRANTHELVGAAAMVDSGIRDLHLSDKTWRVRLRAESEATRRWLPHLLNAGFVRDELRRRATGTSGSMKNISQETFLRIRVPLPPERERRAIAQLLDALSARQQLTERLLFLKRRYKRGLMQQLLTGQRPTHSGVDAWCCHRLGELFRERIDTDRPDLPLLSITADRGVIPRGELERRDTSNADKRQYLRIAPGDIGYNTMRMWQGVSALSTLDGIVSPAYTICTPTDKIDGEFAAVLLKLPSLIALFRRHSQGLVDDTLNLKFHHFAQISVRIPPLDEQRAIARIATTLDREIALLIRLRDKLAEQKRALLDRLLTGRIRLTSDDA